VLNAVQFGVAGALRHQPVGWLVAAAFVVGAPIAHALGVLIHEASHNLVFKETWKNKAIAIVANLALAAPAAIDFRHQHLLHHRYLGDAREPEGGDTQAPMRKEVRFVGRSSAKKILSFTFGRFFYASRPANKAPLDGWFVLNVVACLAVTLCFTVTFGWRSLFYLVASPLLGFGPHPLGARRLSEHVTLRPAQPTNSYYGVANWISFDVGYHVEHHDFPGVPWRRIRRVRALGRAHYETLAAVPSWTGLILAYFFSPRFHVGQYVGLSDEYLEPAEGEEART
jgi:sphingolipid delta-4 desaturase